MKRIHLPDPLTCRRCQHVWTPRQVVVRICPRCKSANWQTPRRVGKSLRAVVAICVLLLLASSAFAQPQPSKRWLRITQAVAIGAVALDVSGTWAARGIGASEQNPFYPQDRRAILAIQSAELGTGLWALDHFYAHHPKLSAVTAIAGSSLSLICGVRSWHAYRTMQQWQRSKWR